MSPNVVKSSHRDNDGSVSSMYELCKLKLEVTLLILYLFEIIDRTTNKGDVSPPSPQGGGEN